MTGWVPTEAGRHLSRRVAKNTAPEILLRKAIHAQGGRFRLHARLAKGCTPDLVLPRRHLAVFVDGCFWHGCPEHGRKRPWEGPNADLWRQKLENTARRDALATAAATALGWVVVRVWECEVHDDPTGTAQLVLGQGREAGEKRRSNSPR